MAFGSRGGLCVHDAAGAEAPQVRFSQERVHG